MYCRKLMDIVLKQRGQGVSMICPPELLQAIKEAIEHIDYGSVEITLNSKGNWFEIITKEKRRLGRDEIE